MTNEEMLEVLETIRKDVFGTSDLSTGGKLNNEQADAFIQKLHDYSVMTGDMRKVKMNAPKRDIDKIGFSGRIAVAPGAEGTTPGGGHTGDSDAADIKKPTTSKVTLSTEEVDVYVDLGFQTVEDNIERGGLEDTTIELVAKRLQTDLEELYLKGDTATGSTDPYLDLLDGWLKQTTTNVYAHASAAFSEDAVFGGMLDKLPNKYFRTPEGWVFYVSPKIVRKIRRERAARQTGGGDLWLTGNPPLTYEGVTIKGVPLMANQSAMLVHPDNVIIGIQRDITFDRFRHARRRVWELTWTLRTDTKFEEEDAVVEGTNIDDAV